MSIGWKVHSTILTRRHILPCQAFALTKLNTTKVHIASHCPIPIEKETVTASVLKSIQSHTHRCPPHLLIFFSNCWLHERILEIWSTKNPQISSLFWTCIWILSFTLEMGLLLNVDGNQCLKKHPESKNAWK